MNELLTYNLLAGHAQLRECLWTGYDWQGNVSCERIWSDLTWLTMSDRTFASEDWLLRKGRLWHIKIWNFGKEVRVYGNAWCVSEDSERCGGVWEGLSLCGIAVNIWMKERLCVWFVVLEWVWFHSGILIQSCDSLWAIVQMVAYPVEGMRYSALEPNLTHLSPQIIWFQPDVDWLPLSFSPDCYQIDLDFAFYLILRYW